MKLKKQDPHSQEVIEEAVEMNRRVTPEVELAFVTYRTPGTKVTDMTGCLGEDGRHTPSPEVYASERGNGILASERGA